MSSSISQRNNLKFYKIESKLSVTRKVHIEINMNKRLNDESSLEKQSHRTCHWKAGPEKDTLLQNVQTRNPFTQPKKEVESCRCERSPYL